LWLAAAAITRAAFSTCNAQKPIYQLKSEKLQAENAELKARLEKLERLISSKNGGGKRKNEAGVVPATLPARFYRLNKP
jgi:hypothetical protein